jgi:hypothetical protein
VVYKTSIGEVATGINQSAVATDQPFSLYQNTPNPFSAITTIEFSVPVSSACFNEDL